MKQDPMIAAAVEAQNEDDSFGMSLTITKPACEPFALERPASTHCGGKTPGRESLELAVRRMLEEFGYVDIDEFVREAIALYDLNNSSKC
jgi:hypothetical protein